MPVLSCNSNLSEAPLTRYVHVGAICHATSAMRPVRAGVDRQRVVLEQPVVPRAHLVGRPFGFDVALRALGRCQRRVVKTPGCSQPTSSRWPWCARGEAARTAAVRWPDRPGNCRGSAPAPRRPQWPSSRPARERAAWGGRHRPAASHRPLAPHRGSGVRPIKRPFVRPVRGAPPSTAHPLCQPLEIGAAFVHRALLRPRLLLPRRALHDADEVHQLTVAQAGR